MKALFFILPLLLSLANALETLTMVWVTGTDEQGITRTTQSIFTQLFKENNQLDTAKPGNLHWISTNADDNLINNPDINKFIQNKYSHKDEENNAFKRNGNNSFKLILILLSSIVLFGLINLL